MVIQAVTTVKLKGGKKITNLERLSRLEIKTSILCHYMTKISVARKRGYASCEFKKCLPQRRQSAFCLSFKVGRIRYVLEAPHGGGPVRVGLCKDSALPRAGDRGRRERGAF